MKQLLHSPSGASSLAANGPRVAKRQGRPDRQPGSAETNMYRSHSCAFLVGLLCAFPALAQENDAGTITPERLEGVVQRRPYSPYANRKFPERPLFGDTHLHTAVSFDAGMVGTRLMPADAYRFAKGEQVISSSGQPVRLSRPLDFLVVADHSDNYGMAADIVSGAANILAVPEGRRWYNLIQEGKDLEAAMEAYLDYADGGFPEGLNYSPDSRPFRSAWEQTIKAADDANDPGRFTAFIGYEWSSNPGGNLHRNVIFRDDGTFARQVAPLTTAPPVGTTDPRGLWEWMQAYETKTGGDVLAIAHNGNLSNGLMFPMIEPVDGKPIDLAYAQTRARWEPLFEVTQIKGDSEAHPFLSRNDEMAGYETWDKGNLDMTVAKNPEMLQYEYARGAFKNGLKLKVTLGENPYKFGLVGSTDAHTGLAAVEENNYFGKITPEEPSVHRLSNVFLTGPAGSYTGWELAASGYAAVWATENTREAIFDAMERREAYATTGPRMIVRFFGGWDFELADATSRTPAEVGYTRGVPMGGDLRAAPKGVSPRFLVAALRDSIGANLDRVQIVKGWLDKGGTSHEQVYDAAWSGSRAPGPDGKLPSVGNTVDVKTATWTNTIGSSELITVWEDPAFDPAQHAFYYARVIEIPTPRWTAYDQRYFAIKDVSPDVPMTTQERAYTSPIWYTPG